MSSKRLLIIEDDIDVAEMLVTFFEVQGYEVFHGYSGEEGIAIARSKFPNLILLDLMLPDMTGYDVCKALRTTTLTKYIPITFLTQRDGRNDKLAGFEIGGDDYITKPFDIEELRLRVQGSIRRATRDHLHETRTGLPTGRLLDEEYKRLKNQSGWHYLDVRIIGFEEFRDLYGFIAADEAVSMAANVLTTAIIEHGSEEDFIGVKGENTFTIFTNTSNIKKFEESIRNSFKTRAEALYKFTDVAQGHIVVNNGTPDAQDVPLMHFVLLPHAAASVR
jgi:PleD family two-component response regulator